MTAAWHIITGEYPPALGGVAGYTRSVARALARAGDEVHVWTPRCAGHEADDTGVRIHRLGRGYQVGGLPELTRRLAREPSPKRLLIQFVPQAFGVKGMNVPFCAWARRIPDAEVWLMFHEVATPWGSWWHWKRSLASAVGRLMVRLLLRRADRVFVSIPLWESMLHEIAPEWHGRATWLPVPSNVPTSAPLADVRAARTRLPLASGGTVVGHFGSYGTLIAPFVERAICDLLHRDPRRVALLIGRGSDAMAARLRRDARAGDRVFGTGCLELAEIAAHLSACDVLVQPYPDGVSTRRTSLMAGLALGVPTVTNGGFLTESLWASSGAVQLVDSVEELAPAAAVVLADPDLARHLALRARKLYERMFAIEVTIDRLRSALGREAA